MTQESSYIVGDEISSWQDFGSILKNGEDKLFNQMLEEVNSTKKGSLQRDNCFLQRVC
jgi:hypothetical protein